MFANMISDLNTNPRLAELRAALRPIEARLRLREAAALAPTSWALGLGAALALAAASRFSERITPANVLSFGLVLVCSALLTTTLYALLRRRDPLATARSADSLLGLDERLATAWEWAERERDISLIAMDTLREIQRQDALARARGVTPARALPVEMAARRLVPGGIALLLIMAVLLFPSVIISDQQADAARAQIGQEAQKVDAMAETLAKDPRLAQDPKLQELLAELGELSRDLREGGLTREEALARLSESEDELQKALEPGARGEAEAIEKLVEQLANAESAAAREAGAALKAGDSQRAADALDRLSKEASTASPQERESLAQALREARDEIVALDPETARRLNEAADALSGDDPQAAQRAMEELGKRATDVAERAATQEQVRQALARIQSGKQNIASAGQPTPGVTSGTAIAGSPQTGSPVAQVSAIASTPAPPGSPVAVGSPVQGTPTGAGTPVVASGGTPAVPGTPGGEQGTGQNGQGRNSDGQQQDTNQDGGQTNNGPGGSSSWGTAHQEPVSVPPSQVNAQGTPISVGGNDNPDGERSSASTGTDVNNISPAQVPYSEVYGTYREQAGKALDSDYIPQGYKDLVRDYFSEIEPK